MFQVHAVGYVPLEVYRPPPKPGQVLEIDFDLRAGIGFPVHVTTGDHKPISTALVHVGWQHEQHSTWVKSQSDEQGMAACGPVPAGPLYLEVSHEGYVQQSKYDLYFKETASTPIEVVLPRAGAIEGRTTFHNSPVDTFVIEYWDNGLDPKSKLFQSTYDGHFRIDEAPLGRISILAHALDGRRSDVHRVDVSTSPTRVDLELSSALRGMGRVIDALTSEPLPEATVQPWDVVDGIDFSHSAPACQVDAEGRFDTVAFCQGLNSIETHCPGYAPVFTSSFATGDTVDFGAIPLSRPAILQIVLDCDEDADPRKYWTEVMAPVPAPIQAFPANKVIRFGDASNAEYTVDGLYPDGTVYRVKKLIQGRHNTIEIKARHLRTLKGLLVPAPGSDPRVSSCSACFTMDDGATVMLGLHIDEEHSVDLSTVPVEDFRLLVVDETGVYLADEIIHGASSLASPLRIPLDGEHSYVKVIDADNAPVPGVYVMIMDPSDRFHSVVSATTDIDGRAVFSMTTNSIADFVVSLTDRSTCLFPSVSLKSSIDHPVTLRIDPSYSVQLSVMDGDVPVPGVVVSLTSQLAPSYTIATQQSNDSGALIVFPRLGKGEYVVSQNQEGIWPKSEVIESERNPGQRTFQVRRVGSANVQVVRNGLPVAGLMLGVSSVEFSTNVSEWLSRSLCLSSTGSLQTDEFGKLRLDGLPHGSYRLETELPSGEVAGTLFTVEPYRVIDATLLVP